jgi:TetR/AcrR family transcriptional regulator, transcriptional repressor for nem operon
MARPRQFNEQQVIDRVADLFTEHGYNGTSMSMLTDLQAIDCSSTRFAQRLSGMQTAPTGRLAIDAFFSVLLGVCLSDNPAENSCIISSGLLEAINEDAIPNKLTKTWLTSHHYLKLAIEQGQRDGSIRSDMTANTLADILMTLMSGLRVSGRVIKQKAALKKIVVHSLEVLNPRD